MLKEEKETDFQELIMKSLERQLKLKMDQIEIEEPDIENKSILTEDENYENLKDRVSTNDELLTQIQQNQHSYSTMLRNCKTLTEASNMN